MIDSFLFLFAFMVQILLASYFIPKKITDRMKAVYTQYPPEQYPKLYPASIENYHKGRKRFMMMNQLALGLGLIIWGAVLHFDYSNRENISEAIPAIFFVIQFIPYILLELSEFSYFKQMRAKDERTVKTVELTRRSLFDFVSPIKAFAAIALITAFIIVDIYVNQHIHQFEFSFSHGTVLRAINILVVNSLLGAIVYWNIFGTKMDPYQSGQDRGKSIKATVDALFNISIFASLYMIIREGTDDMDVEKYQAGMMSIYFIFIIYMSTYYRLKSLDLKSINFDVYKKNGASA